MYQCASCGNECFGAETFKLSVTTQQRSRRAFTRSKYIGDLCKSCAATIGVATVADLVSGIARAIRVAAYEASKQSRMEV